MRVSIVVGAAVLLSVCSCDPTGEGEGEGEPVEQDKPDAGTGGLSACSPALTILPTESVVDALGLIFFDVQGGTGAWRFSVVTGASSPLLNPLTGAYLAGSIPGDDVIEVTDEGCEGSARAVVHVVPPMVVLPSDATVPPGSTFALEVTGGSGELLFTPLALASGGSLDEAGVYVAGAADGDDRLLVEDVILGGSVEALIRVRAGAQLAADPPAVAFPVGSTFQVRTRDGTGVMELSAGGPAVSIVGDVLTGEAPGTVTIDVVDHFTRQTTTIQATVSAPLPLTLGRTGDHTLLATAAGGFDIDGDGFHDAVVGVPEASITAVQAGAVYVYRGSPAGLEPAPARVIAGADRRDQLGRALLVDDVTGDGLVDLVVTAHQGDLALIENGTLFIYPGEAGAFFAADPLQILSGGGGFDHLGSSVAACDVNGDGRKDLIVGANLVEDRLQTPVANNQGGLHLFLGYPDGFLERPDNTVFGVLPDAQGALVGAPNLQLGAWLGAGDIDGDGLCDVVTSSLSFATGAPNRFNDGALFVYKGLPPSDLSQGGLSAQPVRIYASLAADDPGAQLGRRIVVKDLDGDGRAEILASAHLSDVLPTPGTNAGAVRIFSGGPLPETPATSLEDARALAVLSLVGSNANDQSGFDVTVADATGDGVVDVVLGSFIDEGAPPLPGDAGAVVVFPGRSGDLPDPGLSTVFGGLVNGDRFGEAVAVLGDVDGDGHVDLLTHAALDDALGTNVGASFFVSGDPTVPPARLDEPGVSSGSGISRGLAFVGDVTGDGLEDLAVGADEAGLTPEGVNTGTIAVFSGSALPSPAQEGVRIEHFPQHGGGDRLGFWLTSAGDFDGDGRRDLAAAARNETRPAAPDATWQDVDGCVTAPAQGGMGAGYVFPGDVPADGAALRPSFVFFGFHGGGALERVVGGFDYNDDGLSDLLASSPFVDRPDRNDVGGAFVVLGASRGTSPTRVLCNRAVELRGLAPFDNLGRALAPVGDVDGDGCAEVAIGADNEDLGTPNQGTVRIVFGAGAACASGTPQVLVFRSNEANAQAGGALAGGGDVDGDGVPDLVVGVPSHRRGGDVVGGVFLLPGARIAALRSSSVPLVDDQAPATTFPLADAADPRALFLEGEVPGGRFGAAVALVPRAGPGARFDVAIGVPLGAVSGVALSGGAVVVRVDATGFADVVFAFGGETGRAGGQVGESVTAGRVGGQPFVAVGGSLGSGLGLDEGAAYAAPLP